MTNTKTKYIVNYWKRRKELMLKGFGSKCQICGYNKCNSALEFHHINPAEKDLTLSHSIYSWQTTKNELSKCICVCANCHREIHEGLIDIDSSIQYFDSSLVDDYNPTHTLPTEYYDTCPICGGKKLKTKKACSRQCFNKLPNRVNWEQYDIIDMVENKHISFSSIARMLDISATAVQKRYKKIKNIKNIKNIKIIIDK